MELKIHPDLQKHIWPLRREEFNQLEENILAEGIRDKIIAWRGYIVDGHNSYLIAQKHNIPYEVEEYEFEDIEAVKDWMDANQLGRRNLTEDQWQISIGRRYNREKKGITERGNQYTKSATDQNDTKQTADRLADEYKISAPTVKRYAQKAKDFEELSKTKPELAQSIWSGEKSLKEVRKDEKKEEIKAERELAATVGKDINTDIIFKLGDFEEVLSDIPDGSIDCIITDPPYPKEFIECWSKLSRFAARVLKPNGFCIAYSGQYNLPEVINRMSKNLDYYWTFCVYHEGQTQIVNAVNLICRWKPVLIFQNGRSKISNTIQDYFISEQREKSGHDWQQSVSGISYLIDMFTHVDDLIVEPFAGSGTTVIAARKMGRRIIAAEIDEETYNIAKFNIYDKTKE
jgi:DNA modification methylase